MVALAGLFLGLQFLDRGQTLQGSVIEPSPPAVDFELQQADGTPYRLSARKGRVALIFFGYANCPDFCPATLAEYQTIFNNLGEQAGQVDFVFITIDPERDSPEQIDAYVRAFNPAFIGLSGTLEELQPVWEGYWVVREKQEVESEAGYLMAHSTRIYVVDKQGHLRLTFPYGFSVGSMTSDLRLLLAE